MRKWVLSFFGGMYVAALLSQLLAAQDYVRRSQPELFSYDELVQLGSGEEMGAELTEKLRTVTNTPFISNEAYFRGVKPH
jgi:hypothetical protein